VVEYKRDKNQTKHRSMVLIRGTVTQLLYMRQRDYRERQAIYYSFIILFKNCHCKKILNYISEVMPGKKCRKIF